MKIINYGQNVNMNVFKHFLNMDRVKIIIFITYIHLLKLIFILARRLNLSQESAIEFYDVSSLVSQIRSFNHCITECFLDLPWPCVRNLPSFFYRIYLPNCGRSLSNGDFIVYDNYANL